MRISAPGCDLHTSAVKSMTVFADFDTPPLWFPMTPRRVGRLDVTFEMVQGGSVIASVAHTMRVTAGMENDPVASVKSHGGEPPPPVLELAPEPVPAPAPQPKMAKEQEPEETPPEPARNSSRRRDSEEQRQRKKASESSAPKAVDGVPGTIPPGEAPAAEEDFDFADADEYDEVLTTEADPAAESAPLDDWVEYGTSHSQKPPSAPGSASASTGQIDIAKKIDATLGRNRSPLIILVVLLVIVLVIVVAVWLFVI